MIVTEVYHKLKNGLTNIIKNNMKIILKIIAFPVILVISVIEAYITITIKWFEQFKKK